MSMLRQNPRIMLPFHCRQNSEWRVANIPCYFSLSPGWSVSSTTLYVQWDPDRDVIWGQSASTCNRILRCMCPATSEVEIVFGRPQLFQNVVARWLASAKLHGNRRMNQDDHSQSQALNVIPKEHEFPPLKVLDLDFLQWRLPCTMQFD